MSPLLKRLWFLIVGSFVQRATTRTDRCYEREGSNERRVRRIKAQTTRRVHGRFHHHINKTEGNVSGLEILLVVFAVVQLDFIFCKP